MQFLAAQKVFRWSDPRDVFRHTRSPIRCEKGLLSDQLHTSVGAHTLEREPGGGGLPRSLLRYGAVYMERWLSPRRRSAHRRKSGQMAEFGVRLARAFETIAVIDARRCGSPPRSQSPCFASHGSVSVPIDVSMGPEASIDSARAFGSSCNQAVECTGTLPRGNGENSWRSRARKEAALCSTEPSTTLTPCSVSRSSQPHILSPDGFNCRNRRVSRPVAQS